MKFLGFDIEKIPQEIQDISSKWMKIGQTIEDDLNNELVKSAIDYVPQGEVARETVISSIDIAIKALGQLKELGDSAGFKARLMALNYTITAIQHEADTNKKHNTGFYIHCAQIVWDNFFSTSK